MGVVDETWPQRARSQAASTDWIARSQAVSLVETRGAADEQARSVGALLRALSQPSLDLIIPNNSFFLALSAHLARTRSIGLANPHNADLGFPILSMNQNILAPS